MNSKNIIYIYPHPSTFILRDIEILRTTYAVTPYLFDVRKKWLTPFQFIKQLFFLIFRLYRTQVMICHFAGYSSFLPALLGKLFKTPCFIIVAGNDASRFPDFKYGNYTKKLLGYFTGKSLQWAAHILPVHESLVYQDYHYYEGGRPAQGYSYFFPKSKKTPFTPVYYGYDASFFQPDHSVKRVKNSFVTIGNLGDKYAFKRKGSDIIIELARIRPDLHFTLVGWDGIKKFDLPENVTLLRFMTPDEIVKTLSRHEYYFQLSIMEGFPNALAEAMLCGCIPIGSNVSGIPFIIGETGYILNHRDVHELEKLINRALSDEKKVTLSQSARLRIMKHFSYKHRKETIDKLIEMYKG